MSTRHKSRLAALQILYQLDSNRNLTTENALTLFENYFSTERTDEFTKRLVEGVGDHLKEIDAKVEQVSEHWRCVRMATIDRNILRLGVFELEHCDDIPATVTINEMVEVAKLFGSESSPAFVNGILDKVRMGLDRPLKAP